MRLASNGSVVSNYLKSRQEAAMREDANAAANKAKAVNESKVDILGSKLSTARNTKALDEFKMNTRKTLLEMAIGAVFEEIIHEQNGDTRDMSIGKNVISEFVNEFGYDKLARNMLERNLITSQMIGYCEEYYEKIVNEAVAKNKKNAEALHMGSVEVAKEAERGIVDIETLQHTNQELITAIDEIIQIQADGKVARANAEKELAKIEQELKDKMLGIAANAGMSADEVLEAQARKTN